MPLHNDELADLFDEIADLLEISGSNPFRIRAYRSGARVVRDARENIRDLLEREEDLTTLEGIGKDLAEKIKQYAETGQIKTLEELKAKIPAGVSEMLKLQGVGPKKVKALWKELEIESLEQLKEAAEQGRIRSLSGFGEKTESKILKAIEIRVEAGSRFHRAQVVPHAEALLSFVAACPGVKRVECAGSFRRGRETVGDLDIICEAGPDAGVTAHFVTFDEVAEVLAQGPTKGSVRLRNGLQVDLRVVEAKSYGAAMQYFTGSQAHNVATRKRAQKRGLKMNEYGVFRKEEPVAGASEEEVYQALDLPVIPPELREDRGELDAAEADALPDLVTIEQLRGDLHAHTNASDGTADLRGMAAAAKEKGYAYLAVTDHSKRLTIANGLDEDRLLRQMDEIDAVNAELEGIRLLKGVEVDILKDGSLDLSDDVLGRLDLVIGSVHSVFTLPEDQQTERIMRAMDHPHFSILGHPTGRLLLQREPYPVDVPRLVRHARERGCFLEINAHPMRLDLNDTFARLAKEEGVLLSIDTDAHSTADLGLMGHGISQARRGWLEEKDVLNTRSLDELLPMLRGTMG